MANGFEITNDAGIIKLDENSPQLRLYASGSVTTGAIAGSIFATSTAAISVAGNGLSGLAHGMILFMRVTTAGAKVAPLRVYRETSTGNFACTVTSNTANTVVQYRMYISSVFFPRTTSGFGMEVYNSSNQVVYSTTARSMNIISAPVVTMNDGVTVSHSAVPYGSPWYCFPDTIWADNVWDGTRTRVMLWGLSMGSNSFTLGRFYLLGAAYGTTEAVRTMTGLQKRIFVGYDI
jgi:hypothetical protein